MREAEVLITFDMKKLGKEGMKKLHQAEKLLVEAGVSFDTGAGCGSRDWEFDWSLKGPATVYHKKFVEGGDEIATESPD